MNINNNDDNVNSNFSIEITRQNKHNQTNDNSDPDHSSNENSDNEQNANENSTNLILHKTDLILLNNGWNDKNEKLIISIGENAASYKWMHEKCSAYYKLQHSGISILLIVLAVILTTVTITPQIDNNNILSIVFTNLITILSILQNFLKSEQNGEKHFNASVQFNELYHDIQKQMCMYRRDRINATVYLSENLKRYDSLVINNPEVARFVIKQFKTTFKNSNIALPDIADKIQKIEIITEKSDNKLKINRIIKQSNSDNITSTSTNIRDANCNNLLQIHNAFQIHGDISDKDLQNINPIELKELRNKFIQKKSNYEYQRFLQHSNETD